MQSLRSIFQRTLFRYGWDTRCRNLVPIRVLSPVLASLSPQESPVLLDVGSGGFGLAAFLPGVSVVGTDIAWPEAVAPNLHFQCADATALPFLSQAFPIVTCIDVLEHVPTTDRQQIIQELIRVASRAVLVACPHSRTAPVCDQAFRQACEQQGRKLPAWVIEHGRQPYPVIETVVEQVREAAAALGRQVRIAVSYCEPVKVCRLVRAAAATSNVLYGVVNLFFGGLFAWLPASNAESSYRMVVLAELLPKGSDADPGEFRRHDRDAVSQMAATS